MAGYRYPGVEGQPGRPTSDVQDATMGAFASTRPGPVGTEVPQPDLASRVRSAFCWLDLQPIVVRLLGTTSFSAGVVYGMGEDLVSSVVELADLIKILVLAELYDRPRIPSTSVFYGPRLEPVRPTLGSLSGGWLEREAWEAREQRDALIAAARAVFQEPGEAFAALKNEYGEKWERFETVNGQARLSARFEAGTLFGELLLALLGLGAGGLGVARLGAQLGGTLKKTGLRLERAATAIARRRRPTTESQASLQEPVISQNSPRPAAGGDDTRLKLRTAESDVRPGSEAHKADRLARYQARGGTKDYPGWSKQYDVNMRNYQYGLQREAAYREATGAKQETVKTALTYRQIDLLKLDEMYAGQLKSGPVSLTADSAVAIRKDAWLVEQRWKVEHILEQGASKPYL